jgi:pyruvate dehydrogenase kinase 2/3/4
VGSADLTFPYVPSHLHHMVFELVKNSLRAVAERYDAHGGEPPAIDVVVAPLQASTGSEDITIKV